MKNPTNQSEFDKLVAEWHAADQCALATDDVGEEIAAEKRATECERIVRRCMVSKAGIFIATEDDPNLDDKAVDAFATVLKEKLAKARAKGRSGWQTCELTYLLDGMRSHIEKGDPLDVAAYALFLWARNDSTKGVMTLNKMYEAYIARNEDEIATLKARIAELEAEREWRPIGEAPIEEWLLLWHDSWNGGCNVGKKTKRLGGNDFYNKSWTLLNPQPTHFQPLPKGPKEGA